jgi:diaminohydroxyphosphoribosylaminopyrimidine deaminase/5-amino-6-(5-phosphoribosylamino)uracil reductase
MLRALELARRGEGRTQPNPPVGAVIVRDGRIVGEGFHPLAGEPHAEIFALRQAGEASRGADLYVTLEPCCHRGRTGPCVQAVIEAGISRVFVGAIDPNPLVAGGGMAALAAAGIEAVAGINEAECRRLIAPFAKHTTTGLPYVILKAAMTLDGRTATVTGDSQWISGEESRLTVHRLRNVVDAVMVGIGTVVQDNPRLTTRLPDGGRDALRIVVDAELRIPESAAVLDPSLAAGTLVVVGGRAPADKIERLNRRGVQILPVAENAGRLDLADLLGQLGSRGLQSILLEGGSRLNAAALQAGIVDRVLLFFAPLLLGGSQGPGLFAGAGVERLSDAVRLDDVRVGRCGDDTLIEGEVRRCSPA